MKISPIVRELNKRKVTNFLLHTGQHYDKKMSNVFFEELEIPRPDLELNIGSDTQTKQVARIMIAFEKVCEDIQPDAVIVVGDVNSTMACSLVAAKMGINIFHVEAGIRSGDRTMPEEINRLVTDSISNFLLPPSQDAVQNLIKEGHSQETIKLVGNVMIDTLNFTQSKINNSKILAAHNLTKGNYAVLTMHRPSNVDDMEVLTNLIEAIDYIQNKLKVIYPLHPRTKKMLQYFDLYQRVLDMPNLILTESLGYVDFGKLVSNAKFVITDSGGLQEETTIYNIPCITIRNNTERPITISEGTNELAGNRKEDIIKLVDKVLNEDWKKGSHPKYWDGRTAERIVEFVLSKLSRE
jgi:UDP-N-acetylglucosamine 2-epimerase (non-hydrolysing)